MIDPRTAFTFGGAALGALGGGGGTEKIQAMEALPRFLRDDYERMAGGVEGMAAPEYFPDNTVAGMNPMMGNSLNSMYGWGGGMGGDMLNTMYGGGQAGLNAMNQGMDFLNNMGGFQYDQGTFDQTMANLAPGMQSQFDAGARDIQRDFDWNTLPGLNMEAAFSDAGGNSKLYQSGALGQMAADQRIADFGTNLWTNAANQGHAAAMTGGMQNMSNQSNMLNAYGNFGQLGSGMMNQAYNMGLGNMDLGLNAGQIQQGYDQSLVDADVNRWNFEQNMPMQHLQTQLSMIPGPGGVRPGTPGMTPWEGAMQGAMGGMGIYQGGVDAGWWGQPQGTDYLAPQTWMGQDSNIDFGKVWG